MLSIGFVFAPEGMIGSVRPVRVLEGDAASPPPKTPPVRRWDEKLSLKTFSFAALGPLLELVKPCCCLLQFPKIRLDEYWDAANVGGGGSGGRMNGGDCVSAPAASGSGAE